MRYCLGLLTSHLEDRCFQGEGRVLKLICHPREASGHLPSKEAPCSSPWQRALASFSELISAGNQIFVFLLIVSPSLDRLYQGTWSSAWHIIGVQ